MSKSLDGCSVVNSLKCKCRVTCQATIETTLTYIPSAPSTKSSRILNSGSVMSLVLIMHSSKIFTVMWFKCHWFIIYLLNIQYVPWIVQVTWNRKWIILYTSVNGHFHINFYVWKEGITIFMKRPSSPQHLHADLFLYSLVCPTAWLFDPWTNPVLY